MWQGPAQPVVLEPRTLEEALARLQLLATAIPSQLAATGNPLRIPQAAAQAARGAGHGVVVIDERCVIQSLDDGAAAMLRCAAQEAIGLSIDELIEDPRRPGQPILLRNGEARGRRTESGAPSLQISVSPIHVLGQALTSIGLIDTASRSDSKAELRKAEARYRTLIEQIPAVTFSASLDGDISEVYVSPQIEALLGFSQREWISNPVLWFKQLHPEDREVWNDEFARGCATGGPFRAECRFLARDGSVVWVHGEARLVKDEHDRPLFLQGVAFDITESKRAEQMIRASLKEKESLLKEIHHRVKNNLQVTSSLLELQATRMSDHAARQMLRESQDRIRSMSLVHELLYQSQDLARINFEDYVPRLVKHLFRSYSVKPGLITCATEVVDIFLGVDAAAPCGLIINELISNSLKHAFPGDRKGSIFVGMRRCAKGAYQLTVRDDGVGLPPGLKIGKVDTLGLRIVKTLAEQLEGTIEMESMPERTEFRVTFTRGG